VVVQEPEVRFEELDNAIDRAAAPSPHADDPNEGRLEPLVPLVSGVAQE